MKKNNLKTLVITTLICLLPIIVGVIIYNKVPDEMPIHFDIKDNADNYAAKEMVLFGLPTMMTMLHLFIYIFLNKTIKILTEIEEKPKLLKVLEWIIPIITVAIYTIIIIYTLYGKINVGRYVCFLIGIIMCLLGNYFPKMSYEIGKITFYPVPKDEKSFKKTSRLSGYLCFAFGIILLTLMFFI